jgi:hypothetical protein
MKRRVRRWNLDAEYLNLYNQKKNDEEISEILDISPSSAYRIRQRLKLPVTGVSRRKLKVNKEHLKALCDSGYNDKAISETFNCHEQYVKEIRLSFGVKAKKQAEKHAAPNHIQRQIIIGGLFGDSSIQRIVNSSINFKHSLKQRDYAIWKASLLNSIGIRKPYEYSYLDKRTGNTYHTVGMQTLSSIHLNEFHNSFYKNSKTKRISIRHLEELNRIGLAVWYMDDGSLSSNRITLCTNSFTDCEREIIIDSLFKKFNVKFRQRKDGTMCIYKHSEIISFIDIVGPLIHPELNYKVGKSQETFTKMTVRMFYAMLQNKPVSNVDWLDTLIRQNQ